MSSPESKLPNWRARLRNRYRVVVVDDQTFEEKAAFVLSPLNLFVFIGTFTLFFIFLMTYIIAFTSLREYIPGYADVSMKKKMVRLALRADSLEADLRARDRYMLTLKHIIEGRDPGAAPTAPKGVSAQQTARLDVDAGEEDMAFRKNVEAQDRNSLSYRGREVTSGGMASFLFFNPVQGTISKTFNPSRGHWGLDVVTKDDEAVKSTLDGTVTFSGYTPEHGYVLVVQHDHDLISVYRHNAVLLKQSGDRVRAGEPIAVVGKGGEGHQGPHLHLELWYKGSAVNPAGYLSF
jgi:murein DD-endopeptidase MepM/ murein hydrolase activator NlpD